MAEMKKILDDAKKISDWLIDIRRDIHRHPELGHEEHRTAALVEKNLAELGIPSRRIAGTGVLALIEGKNPGKCVGLRADMDALPMQDAKTGDLRSEVNGVMHACGHDAHTTCLLGAARLLVSMKGNLSGSVKLFFQPAEESDGGALPMINEGAMESPKVEAMFGLHTAPECKAGTIKLTAGAMNAACDSFDAAITGAGGHGAYPHTATDVLYTACMCVDALQSVVSRNVPPMESAVVTVGSLHSGTARNIIPARAELSGTIRTLSPATRELATRRVREIMEGVCRTMGADLELAMAPGYPVLSNDEPMTEFVRSAAAETIGPENVMGCLPSLGGEDFAYFAERVPSCFFKLGTGNKSKGITHPLHSALFDIDETALPTGAALLTAVAVRFLRT